MRQLLFLCAFVSLTFAACVQPPDYPDEPVIKFERFNQPSISQGLRASDLDSLEITFSFTDGDGDIGEEADATTEDGRPLFNVFMTDSRSGNVLEQNRIPFIPVQGAGNGISGEITVTVSNKTAGFCCIYDDKDGSDPCTINSTFTRDTFFYSIMITDRTGNESNMVDTAPIIIECD
ncbi:MAG: hypothetical protein AB8G22_18635 [Saprospiraceae bacterium]